MVNALPRRDVLFLLAAGGLSLSLRPKSAMASTALAVSLPELAARSHGIFFGRPVEAQSRWEELASGRRIVTYTRVQVEEGVNGDLEGEYLVRTLGGKVGDTGQIVHGEALLRVGEDNLLFLRRDRDGVDIVTARAQGQYPVAQDDRGAPRLRRSARVAHLVDPEKSAAHVLVGRTVPEARRLVLDALRQK